MIERLIGTRRAERVWVLTIAALFAVGLVVPVSAQECSTGSLDWSGTSATMTEHNYAEGRTILTALNGNFLNMEVSEPSVVSFNDVPVAMAYPGQTVSVGLPADAVSWSVCPGEADLPTAHGQLLPQINPEEPVEREPTEGQQIEDVSAEEWEEHHAEQAEPEPEPEPEPVKDYITPSGGIYVI